MLRSISVFIVCFSFAVSGCNGKTQSSVDDAIESAPIAETTKPKENEPLEVQPTPNNSAQLSAFVRRIFQDKSGNLWFGTNGDGVIRYDGSALEYFSSIRVSVVSR